MLPIVVPTKIDMKCIVHANYFLVDVTNNVPTKIGTKNVVRDHLLMDGVDRGPCYYTFITPEKWPKTITKYMFQPAHQNPIHAVLYIIGGRPISLSGHKPIHLRKLDELSEKERENVNRRWLQHLLQEHALKMCCNSTNKSARGYKNIIGLRLHIIRSYLYISSWHEII